MVVFDQTTHKTYVGCSHTQPDLGIKVSVLPFSQAKHMPHNDIFRNLSIDTFNPINSNALDRHMFAMLTLCHGLETHATTVSPVVQAIADAQIALKSLEALQSSVLDATVVSECVQGLRALLALQAPVPLIEYFSQLSLPQQPERQVMMSPTNEALVSVAVSRTPGSDTDMMPQPSSEPQASESQGDLDMFAGEAWQDSPFWSNLSFSSADLRGTSFAHEFAETLPESL